METLLSRAGDTTGCASFDTDLAALSPTPPTPADPESDCEAGTDDVRPFLAYYYTCAVWHTLVDAQTFGLVLTI